jgi:RimJ/RimL family protein N-acetyltransferase
MDNFNLIGKNFFLRSLTSKDDLKNYLFWMSNPSNNKFILSSNINFTIDMLRKYIDSCNNNDNILLIGIFDKLSGEHIGNIKYDNIDMIDKSSVMGILIGEKEYRGIGLAKTVIQETLNWLYENLGIKKVLLGVDKENLNAFNLYKNIGFVIVNNSHTDEIRMELDIQRWLQTK